MDSFPLLDQIGRTLSLCSAGDEDALARVRDQVQELRATLGGGSETAVACLVLPSESLAPTRPHLLRIRPCAYRES